MRTHKLALSYLPITLQPVIDIGSGESEFAKEAFKKCSNVYLLDANPDTINTLTEKYRLIPNIKPMLYKAPNRLPFDNQSVAYVHCGHLVEHLEWTEVYELLRQIDRVLMDNGILVISSPLLTRKFYDNLSHIRPYNPMTFIYYLCGTNKNRTKEIVSDRYKVLAIKYRYDRKWCFYIKDAYTLIMRKQCK